MWAENKTKKMEQLKEQYADKDIEECTFKPILQTQVAEMGQLK